MDNDELQVMTKYGVLVYKLIQILDMFPIYLETMGSIRRKTYTTHSR